MAQSSPINIPFEIWEQILLSCDVDDILLLEKANHFFRDLISNRHLWLSRLEALDQAHAPDLPRHVPISSLTWADLRDLVRRAHARVRKCTDALHLNPTREIVIHIGQTSVIGTIGQRFGRVVETLLVPGGKHLFIRWHGGYLQCWDVASRECAWTYPGALHGELDGVEVSAKCCFACDVQASGDIHVAIVSETRASDQRRLEVLRFSPLDKSLATLFDSKPGMLGTSYGAVCFAKLCGDISLTYTEGHVVVTFWKEGRTVVIKEGIFDALELVDDYIIGISASHVGNMLVAIPLSFLRTSQSHLKVKDIPTVSHKIALPEEGLTGRSQLSICTFHWKGSRTQRDKMMITVLSDVYTEHNFTESPVADFFSFGSDGSDHEGLPMFTPYGRSQVANFDKQHNAYSITTPPAQAGASVLAFHDDRSQEPRFLRTFAIFVPGKEVKVQTLGLGLDANAISRKPTKASLSVEFYSSAIYYVTRDLESVVIQYMD